MRPNTSTPLLAPLLVAALALALAPQPVRAENFDGGFTLDASNSIGDTSVQGTYFGITPVSPQRQVLMTTISTAGAHDPGPNQSGFNAVSVVNLASFLGVATSSVRDGLVTGQEGSGLLLDLGTVAGGTFVTFNYDFLTNETDGGAHNDFAFVTLTNLSGNTPVVADALSSPLFVTTGAGNPFSLETQYQTYSLFIGTTGVYSLGIGVVDGTTTDTSSALLVDNVAVPEGGASVILLVIALATVEGLRRSLTADRAWARS